VNRYEKARELVLLWAGLERKAKDEAAACDGEALQRTQDRMRAVEHELRDMKAGRELWGEGWA